MHVGVHRHRITVIVRTKNVCRKRVSVGEGQLAAVGLGFRAHVRAANDGGLRGVSVRQRHDRNRQFTGSELQLGEISSRPPSDRAAHEPRAVVSDTLPPLHAHDASMRALQEALQGKSVPTDSLHSFNGTRRAIVGETCTHLNGRSILAPPRTLQ